MKRRKFIAVVILFPLLLYRIEADCPRIGHGQQLGKPLGISACRLEHRVRMVAAGRCGDK
jgi:hypothetical protein